jgi:hypothetical protein
VTTGVTVCTADGGATVCNAPLPTAAPETCNGQDDDCDGEVDEGLGVGAPCVAGAGICEAKGAIVCTKTGGTACSAVPFEAGAEICDGLDNDCDGTVDDGWDVGAPCSTVVLGCLVSGTRGCGADGAGTTCHAEAPAAPCGGSGADAGSTGDAGSAGDAGTHAGDAWEGADGGHTPADARTGDVSGPQLDDGAEDGSGSPDSGGASGSWDGGWEPDVPALGEPQPLGAAPASGAAAGGCSAGGAATHAALPVLLIVLFALRRRPRPA